ncbi:MAG: PD-(D/E)XK nuclease family protein [Bacteroidales bacterium]|nr:PD-(D/E)XK nuclease family protein [Bacteroidales bacterium]
MKNKILNLINSIEFQELNSYYNEKTIFGALNVERNENRHSAFVAWWLNPKSEHGLGDATLKLFLRLVATKEWGESIFKQNDKVDFYSRVLAGDYNITIREDFELEKSVGKLSSNNSKGRIDIWSALELTAEDEDGKDSSLAVGMVIENKIYSNEGKNQTVRYFDAVNSYMKELPSEMEYSGMGILLTATKQKPSCDQFINITYQELLTYVIEPLMSSVDADSSQFVEAFVRNLGRPALTENNKHYGVLAVSKKEKMLLERVVTNNRDIFESTFASLYPSSDVKKIIGERYETLTSGNVDDDNILRMLWDANEILFKAVIYHLYGEHSAKLDKLFKSSNRDNSKYLVSYNEKEIFPDKRLSKAMAACAIFKAYLMEYPATTLAELRKAFPCEKLNAYYYDRYYNDLFYESNPDNVDETGYEILTYTAGKHKGKEAKAKWDFYLDEEKLLPIENGQKNAMCVKMWRKCDFDKLVEFVEENYKFIGIEEC